MPPPQPKAKDKSRLKRLIEIVESLPEALAEVGGRWDEHRKFSVRKKSFGYYSYHHHADNKIALYAKVPPGENSRLAADDPDRYYVPSYLGASGWVGLRMDRATVNWAEVEHLLVESYLLQAPKKLAALLE